MGMTVPSRYAAWVELIAIHLLVPNPSFAGHLAGILTGLVYTNTFIGTIIDQIISSLTGNCIEFVLVLFSIYTEVYVWLLMVPAQFLHLYTSTFVNIPNSKI